MTDDGRLIAGRYRLTARLGSGGMGVVWQARDERLHRPVAVKRLFVPAYLAGPEAEQAKLRAMRESRIAARIQHPNVVAIYDVVEDDGHPCLVMEYVQSRSLAEVLAERGSLTPAEVAQIGVQMARALASAHAAGVVHRDIKPGNVLLGVNGMAKLVDFGIARAVGDVTLTATGLISGTPAYLAPEVARGRDATFASDVFSLGSTLYAAVEGEPPFGRDENAIALLHKVASGVIRPPRRAGPLTGVLLRLLHVRPEHRPTMAQAALTLANVVAGLAPTQRLAALAATPARQASDADTPRAEALEPSRREADARASRAETLILRPDSGTRKPGTTTGTAQVTGAQSTGAQSTGAQTTGTAGTGALGVGTSAGAAEAAGDVVSSRGRGTSGLLDALRARRARRQSSSERTQGMTPTAEASTSAMATPSTEEETPERETGQPEDASTSASASTSEQTPVSESARESAAAPAGEGPGHEAVGDTAHHEDDTAHHEAAQQETAGPEAAQHDAAEHEVADQEVPGQGEAGPDETGPDETGPDETGPDETGQDVRTPDTGTSHATSSATETSDTRTPGAGTPSTGAPGTGAPDTGAPDTGAPDTGAPDRASDTQTAGGTSDTEPPPAPAPHLETSGAADTAPPEVAGPERSVDGSEVGSQTSGAEAPSAELVGASSPETSGEPAAVTHRLDVVGEAAPTLSLGRPATEPPAVEGLVSTIDTASADTTASVSTDSVRTHTAEAVATTWPPDKGGPTWAGHTRGGNRLPHVWLWVVALVVVLTGTAIAAVWAFGDKHDRTSSTRQVDDEGRGPANAPSPGATSSPSASTSPTPTASTSPTPTSPTATPTTATPTTSPSPTVAATKVTAISEYYALMPHQLEAGWTRLSPRYQQRTAGGFAGYQRFWGQMASVSVTNVRDAGGNRVRAQVTYVRKDGRVYVERHLYSLVNLDGRWVIDGSTVLSSRQS